MPSPASTMELASRTSISRSDMTWDVPSSLEDIEQLQWHPNFSWRRKLPRGAEVAKRQACHDGAIGVRATHNLQSYKQEPIYAGNVYTVTSKYHARTGTLCPGANEVDNKIDRRYISPREATSVAMRVVSTLIEYYHQYLVNSGML